MLTMRTPVRHVVLSLLLVWVVSVVAGAQGPEPAARKGVWQGIFTAEQVARGSSAFDSTCVRCHPIDAQGAPLRMSGEAFWNNWADDGLDVLYTRIQSNMPPNAPGSLSPQAYADLVSFILSVNGVPAGGTAELTPADVTTIQLVRRDGPRPVPAGALVSVTGCLVQSGSRWNVESASEPMRSRARDIGADMPQAEKLLPAGKTYELKFPLIPLGSMKGQQVVARGLLARGPDAINVEAVRSLGRPCP